MYLGPEKIRDIVQTYRGKTIAFTPILRPEGDWGIGIAEKGKPGCTVIPGVHSDTYGEAAFKTDQLNKVGLKIKIFDAMDIVASSLAHGRYNDAVSN